MANKSTFQGTYNSAISGKFKANTTKDIGSDDMRALVDSIVANNPFTDDDSYTWSSPMVPASGTTTLTATAAPAISSYSTGQTFKLQAVSTATGNTTLNINAVGAKKLFKAPGLQAGIGDWIVDGIYTVIYDSTLDSAVGGFLIVAGNIDIPDRIISSTLGVSIFFNFNLKKKRLFVGSDPVTAPISVILANEANAIEYDFVLNIQDVAAILTFQSDYISNDVRWNASTKAFEFGEIGYYKGHAVNDGTHWFLDISPSPYL